MIGSGWGSWWSKDAGSGGEIGVMEFFIKYTYLSYLILASIVSLISSSSYKYVIEYYIFYFVFSLVGLFGSELWPPIVRDSWLSVCMSLAEMVNILLASIVSDTWIWAVNLGAAGMSSNNSPRLKLLCVSARSP